MIKKYAEERMERIQKQIEIINGENTDVELEELRKIKKLKLRLLDSSDEESVFPNGQLTENNFHKFKHSNFRGYPDDEGTCEAFLGSDEYDIGFYPNDPLECHRYKRIEVTRKSGQVQNFCIFHVNRELPYELQIKERG